MDVRYKLKITPLAYNDIDKVLDYISSNLMNPDAAADLYGKIEKKMQDITKFPFSYPDCKYYFIPLENYRHTAIGNYVLFYRVAEESHTVEILRFLYSRMDFSKIQIQID